MTRAQRTYWAVTGFVWVVLLTWLALSPSPEFIERYYTRGLYRVINGILPALTEPFPFSIALVLVLVILLGFPGAWLWRWRKGAGTHWQGFFWGVKGLLLLCPLIVCWFLFNWGIGYGRMPAEQRLELAAVPVTDEESAMLRARLLEIMRADAQPADERDPDAAVRAIAAEMREVVEDWDGKPIRIPDGVKRTPPGLLLANGTAGMAVPLTLEPHVDGGLPDTSFVYVAAHELGHVAGMNAESEATLAGFAAGIRADHPYARYAVALDMYTDLVRQLPSKDMKAAVDALPQIAKDDLQASREARRRYRIDWFGDVSWRAYDQYLKAQGIKEGRKNYGKGITLFVYAWRHGLAEVPGLESPGVPVAPEEAPA